ncbi:hypothetical protein KIL84_018884 [Mauremys mutica]|uniref:Uncharacterized protein n=1 Tax=Mauremys mutica TaxID=74926 RepID=A0A9D4BA39_9SAUR|nr:hypothetical protein KIL84_018884 [Mauremys mutica]
MGPPIISEGTELLQPQGCSGGKSELLQAPGLPGESKLLLELGQEEGEREKRDGGEEGEEVGSQSWEEREGEMSELLLGEGEGKHRMFSSPYPQQSKLNFCPHS